MTSLAVPSMLLQVIPVPQSFRDMPRWWGDQDGRAWLDALPRLVSETCRAWNLSLDGPPAHGSNALVVPVLRGSVAFALRFAPPGDDVTEHARALRFWAGRGTVLLHDVDVDTGALLLERLDGSRTLAAQPLAEALQILAELTSILAVPAAPADEVRGTDQVAAEHTATFERDWHDAGRPVDRTVLDSAIACAAERAVAPVPPFAVDGDLHFDQVLAGTRATWLVVDPVLLRGDPEYDLGRILWSRLDEIPDDAALLAHFEAFVAAASVPAERARSWVVIRAMSYLLWGLAHGLTLDPPRCRRLLDVFV